MKKEDIIVYTDGACSGNPGPGGWGSIVYLNGLVTELAGSELKTTNNRMELAATLNAIQFILQQLGSSKYNNQTVSLVGDVFVYTDSVYVIKGITQWVFGWKKKSWINSKNESVVNQDIWIDLDQSVAKLQSQLQKKL